MMSGIGAVARADAHAPAKQRKTPERERGEAEHERRPPAKQDERNITEADKRRLDVEA
jgi:hypothetical protein